MFVTAVSKFGILSARGDGVRLSPMDRVARALYIAVSMNEISFRLDQASIRGEYHVHSSISMTAQYAITRMSTVKIYYYTNKDEEYELNSCC
jgi:hypothetical protein